MQFLKLTTRKEKEGKEWVKCCGVLALVQILEGSLLTIEGFTQETFFQLKKHVVGTKLMNLGKYDIQEAGNKPYEGIDDL